MQMEPSSQQQPPQPPQEELAEGLPQGYPPKRAADGGVGPLDTGLQAHLDQLMRNQAKRVEKPLRKPSWDHSSDATESDKDS